jgi:glyoxalase family protein
MQLTGFHHLTAVSANAPGNHDFYTRILGMRLAKKTVNQDDTSAYHLFYTDGLASPGTDITFFEWPVPRERRGTNSVTSTGLRVDASALDWWQARLDAHKVSHSGIAERDGTPVLDFEDFEGQRLTLLGETAGSVAHPWEKSPVPAANQIRGLGAITMTVANRQASDVVLQKVMAMEPVRDYQKDGRGVTVYRMGGEGHASELHVEERRDLPEARQGAGSVHHIAFRTPTFAEYDGWFERLKALRVPSSGPVDRFYFRSLYFREPNGILFEIATDEPGFTADEPLDTLGQKLALPPFLEGRRAEIEAGLKPL